ncbi:MAG: zinc ribbon domain-containing protein [Candidatus Hermodarchaeota archaeon]
MSRKESTWFGIKLSRKHATQIFILSLAGVFILSMISLPMISSFIMSLINAIKYDELEWWLDSLVYNIPYFGVFITFLIISIYSVSKSRRVAKSYSDIIEPQQSGSRSLKFCPNCGNERIGIEKFCRTCGEEFS